MSAPTPDVRLELQLRNTPKANRISVSCGDWRESIDLAPGEERRVALPPNRVGSRAATVIRIHPEIGVRPADLEPANGDLRLLGVWVEIGRK